MSVHYRDHIGETLELGVPEWVLVGLLAVLLPVYLLGVALLLVVPRA